MKLSLFCLGAAAQQTEGAEEAEAMPNYEEKAQEIVQSILQEVVNTVAGGEKYLLQHKRLLIIFHICSWCLWEDEVWMTNCSFSLQSTNKLFLDSMNSCHVSFP